MPEIAEVALYAQSIRFILDHHQLISIEVIGGKYYTYEIHNDQGQWVNKIINPKTGRLINIDPNLHLGGRYVVNLPQLEIITAQLPLSITGVYTKGKYCWIEIGQWHIGLTFGMSGSIMYPPTIDNLIRFSQAKGKPLTATEYTKHFHVKFTNELGQCFYFSDPRRFGTITLTQDRQQIDRKLNSLGADLLQTPQFSSQQFIQLFQPPGYQRQNICQLLMSQSPLAGIGNYLLNELLYRCQINPWALVRDLSEETLQTMYMVIKDLVKTAYQMGGSSLYTYLTSQGDLGRFQHLLQVYNQKHDPLGHEVKVISETQSPDHRTKHYVPEIQIIGRFRDPLNKIRPLLTLKKMI